MKTPFDILSDLPAESGINWKSALAWLGRQNWVSYTERTDNTFRTNFRPLFPPTKEISHALQLLMNQDNIELCIRAKHLAASLVTGQKILRANTEQCRSMENVSINVPNTEYHQPYPALYVEFSTEYRQEITERIGHQCPKYCLVRHDSNSHYIFLFTRNENDKWILWSAIAPKYGTIENALQKCFVETGVDMLLLQTIGRVAINMCMMLIYLGVKEKPWASPSQISELKKRTRNPKRNKALKAQAELETLPKIIAFAQDISFYENERSGGEEGEGEGNGTPHRPHWRRGHFRHQHWGRGRSEIKLIFIKPVLVNRSRFVGNESDTLVLYRGREFATS
jgi:hypothetical protein